MAVTDRAWLLLPRQLRGVPADLAAVLGYIFLTNCIVLLPVVNETPLRIVFGLPFVLFVPGYALIAALFPEGASTAETEDEAEAEAESDIDTETTDTATETGEPAASSGHRTGGIDGIERAALSLGLSISVVPLIGLVLNFTPWGIRLVPIMVSVSVLVVGATIVAVQRRWALPPDERFRVPYRQWIATTRAELFEPDTRMDAALNVVLVLSVVLAVSSVAYAVAVPKQGESFTEFYLLTETADGELVADNFPREFTAGENRSLVVGIGNQEHEQTDYTVVVQLQRVQVENNSTTVLESERLRKFETSLAHNETWQHQHTIRPTMTGQRLRLAYLLYRDSVPQSPTIENAYRTNHLWVNVTDA